MMYIILPVHNRREITKSFILDLKKQTFTQFKLILVDDGSTDGTSEMAKSLIRDLTIINGTGNLWWAGALHEGYKYITSLETKDDDIVLIINDDTNIKEDFLQRAYDILKSKGANFLLKAQCYNSNKQIKDTGVEINWRKFSFKNTEDNSKINCVSTRGLFMYMKTFKEIGGFYPKLLPHYTSDYEYTYRAYKKGFKIIIDTSLILEFNEKTTGLNLIDLKKENKVNYIKKLFSIKSVNNPIIFTIFILLSSPLKYKFLNIIRVWKRAFF